MRPEIRSIGQGGQLVQRFLPRFKPHLPLLHLLVRGGRGDIVLSGRARGQLQIVLAATDDDADTVVQVGISHLKERELWRRMK